MMPRPDPAAIPGPRDQGHRRVLFRVGAGAVLEGGGEEVEKVASRALWCRKPRHETRCKEKGLSDDSP